MISSNPYLWNMLGFDNEKDFMEHIKGSFKGIVCSEDRDRVETFVKRQIEENASHMDSVEYCIIDRDGRKVPVVDYRYLERQPQGDIFYVFMTERKNR